MIRIVPRSRDLGDGFQVRRVLPSKDVRSVGPFVFFDEFGPTAFGPGQGFDVRPHPHIGLATVTYLLDGEILHRDSLGTIAAIRPGEVNWMTAGRGIVHSERTPPSLRTTGSQLAGVQTWIALPEAHEEDEPSFVHHDRLPVHEADGASVRVILGRYAGASSPVRTLSETFYADAALNGGARMTLPASIPERAAYVVDGIVEIDGEQVQAGTMLLLPAGNDVRIEALVPARLMLVGGAPLGPRYVWWNFVSTRKERIREAAEDWTAGRFPPVPDEHELIPLPSPAPGVVDYP